MQVSCWVLSLCCSQNKHGRAAQSKPQRPPRSKAFLLITPKAGQRFTAALPLCSSACLSCSLAEPCAVHRSEDIPMSIWHFLPEHNMTQNKRSVFEITPPTRVHTHAHAHSQHIKCDVPTNKYLHCFSRIRVMRGVVSTRSQSRRAWIC